MLAIEHRTNGEIEAAIRELQGIHESLRLPWQSTALSALVAVRERRAAEAAADTGQAQEPQPVALEWRADHDALERMPVQDDVDELVYQLGRQRECKNMVEIDDATSNICQWAREFVPPLIAALNGNTAPQGEGARDE